MPARRWTTVSVLLLASAIRPCCLSRPLTAAAATARDRDRTGPSGRHGKKPKRDVRQPQRNARGHREAVRILGGRTRLARDGNVKGALANARHAVIPALRSEDASPSRMPVVAPVPAPVSARHTSADPGPRAMVLRAYEPMECRHTARSALDPWSNDASQLCPLDRGSHRPQPTTDHQRRPATAHRCTWSCRHASRPRQARQQRRCRTEERVRPACRSPQTRRGPAAETASDRVPTVDGLVVGVLARREAQRRLACRMGRCDAERLDQSRALLEHGLAGCERKRGLELGRQRHEPPYCSGPHHGSRPSRGTNLRTHSRRQSRTPAPASLRGQHREPTAAATTRTAFPKGRIFASTRPSTSICFRISGNAKLAAKRSAGIRNHRSRRDRTRRLRSSARTAATAGPLVDVGSYKTLAGFPWDRLQVLAAKQCKCGTVPPVKCGPAHYSASRSRSLRRRAIEPTFDGCSRLA